MGVDSKIPDEGLAIFHIDENAIECVAEGHPGQDGVAMLQADGMESITSRKAKIEAEATICFLTIALLTSHGCPSK